MASHESPTLAPRTRRTYVRRRPEETALLRVVRDGFEAFARDFEARHEGEGLPRFVQEEFERFMECGDLSAGLCRFKCSSCGAERLVALSCSGRGFCPSCLGRRMVERSAHLVDSVFPRLPVRHWILSLPFELRSRLAWDHELCRKVLRVFWRVLEKHLTYTARKLGHANARSGAVTVIQRVRSSASLHLHFHTLAIDGAFSVDDDGRFDFHRALEPYPNTLMRMVERIHKGTVRLLGRLDLLCDETGFPEPDGETETPAMAELYEASVRQMLTTGPRAGQKPLRLRSAASVPPGEKTGKRSARAGGFDLYATKAIPKDHRERLEKVCRYLLRPPIPQERLEYKGKLAILRLPAPRSDGTTHLCFEPRELVEKLSAMVPRPRTNLLLYQGVLSGNAFMRDRVIRFGEPPLLSTRIEKPRPRRLPLCTPKGPPDLQGDGTRGVSRTHRVGRMPDRHLRVEWIERSTVASSAWVVRASL